MFYTEYHIVWIAFNINMVMDLMILLVLNSLVWSNWTNSTFRVLKSNHRPKQYHFALKRGKYQLGHQHANAMHLGFRRLLANLTTYSALPPLLLLAFYMHSTSRGFISCLAMNRYCLATNEAMHDIMLIRDIHIVTSSWHFIRTQWYIARSAGASWWVYHLITG